MKRLLITAASNIGNSPLPFLKERELCARMWAVGPLCDGPSMWGLSRRAAGHQDRYQTLCLPPPARRITLLITFGLVKQTKLFFSHFLVAACFCFCYLFNVILKLGFCLEFGVGLTYMDRDTYNCSTSSRALLCKVTDSKYSLYATLKTRLNAPLRFITSP